MPPVAGVVVWGSQLPIVQCAPCGYLRAIPLRTPVRTLSWMWWGRADSGIQPGLTTTSDRTRCGEPPAFYR